MYWYVAVHKKPNPQSFSFTELKRHWEDLSQLCNAASAKGRKQKWPFDFSVMSYNILSQDLLCDNTYLYRHCNPPVLDWHHRFPNIIKELEQHSADVSEWAFCERIICRIFKFFLIPA